MECWPLWRKVKVRTYKKDTLQNFILYLSELCSVLLPMFIDASTYIGESAENKNNFWYEGIATSRKVRPLLTGV